MRLPWLGPEEQNDDEQDDHNGCGNNTDDRYRLTIECCAGGYLNFYCLCIALLMYLLIVRIDYNLQGTRRVIDRRVTNEIVRSILLHQVCLTGRCRLSRSSKGNLCLQDGSRFRSKNVVSIIQGRPDLCCWLACVYHICAT